MSYVLSVGHIPGSCGKEYLGHGGGGHLGGRTAHRYAKVLNKGQGLLVTLGLVESRLLASPIMKLEDEAESLFLLFSFKLKFYCNNYRFMCSIRNNTEISLYTLPSFSQW